MTPNSEPKRPPARISYCGICSRTAQNRHRDRGFVMPAPGLGLRRTPRLAPELDDRALGSLLRQLQARPMPGLTNMQVDLTERLLHRTDTDRDRRWIGTIAGAFADSNFAEGWLRRSPSADALASLFHCGDRLSVCP